MKNASPHYRVIAGLDPAIHDDPQQRQRFKVLALRSIMDARVIGVRKHAVLRTAMPAHDEWRGRTPPLPSPGVAQHAHCRVCAAVIHTPMPSPRLRRSFFDRPVLKVAPDLIGATLLVDGVGGVIVELEAYHHTEPAAHSFNGRTERNAVMFGPAGYVYVYRSYGIHWCVNFVCEEEGSASAVLIRALEPTHGIPTMQRRRGLRDERALCSGPGKLCEALAITHKHNGLALDRAPFELRARSEKPEIVTGVRIGITKAADKPWRYGLKGSPFLSKPFR
jgi:DNA-3-methyladenine glycosylase